MEGNLLEKLDAYLHCKLLRWLQWNNSLHNVAINENWLSLFDYSCWDIFYAISLLKDINYTCFNRPTKTTFNFDANLCYVSSLLLSTLKDGFSSIKAII